MWADAGAILRAMIQARKYLHERVSKKEPDATISETAYDSANRPIKRLGDVTPDYIFCVRFMSLVIGKRKNPRLTRAFPTIRMTAYFLFERGAQSLDHLAKSAFP